MSSGINRDEWLKALTDSGFVEGEDDQQAVTIGEFAAMFGLTLFTARRRLEALVAAGRARRTKKRQQTVAGRMMYYIAYRLESA